MTKNSPSSAIQTRAKEIGFSLNSSSLKKVKEHSIEDIILKQAEVFWQEYYSQKAKNVLENTKERGYNLSFEQQRGVDFLKNQEDHNCTIIAPTGFGKTLVVFEEMYRLLSTKNRIFFTAPTNDLLNQQYEAFCYFCEQKQQDVTVKRMEKGSEAFEDAKVVFLTPHLFEAIAGKNQVENNDVLVCDEMHTGEGRVGKTLEERKYPSFEAMKILKQHQKGTRIIGMTATTNKNMFQEVFSESHVCRLGTREDFKKKQFHFDAPWSEIIGKSGIEDIHGLCESQKEKIAMDCCTLVRRSPSFYREDIFSMDILMGFTHTSDKKDEILKCIEAQHLKPESKKFLKNALYKIANINKYRDYCNEHNYRIFIDKLWKDYEASKYKNTDEALFIEKLGKRVKKMIVEEKRAHPKEMMLDETLAQNKGKTMLVYVENEALIRYFMKKYSNKYKCSFLKSSKNNTQKIINDYTREAMNAKKLDVVFATSAMKLGMNFDVNNLYFYHMPKNDKDWLQFLGRIGRFGNQSNHVYCYYPNATIEKGMSYTVSKQAQKYIDEFFGDDEVGRVPEKVNKEQNENTHKVQHFLFPMSEIQYKYPEKRKRKK